MEFEIVGNMNMLAKFSSSEYDAYIIMSVVDTCLCIDSYGYKDDYLRENNYEDQHLNLIIGAVYRVFEEWNFNQTFFMSLAEIKEVLQIAKFMLRADTHAIQNLQTISGYSHFEMSQTFDTLERALECFDLPFRLYGPMQYKIISKTVINLSLNSNDQNMLTRHLIYKMEIAKYAEEFIKTHHCSNDFLENTKAIGNRILYEYYENHSFDISKLEIHSILQVLRFIFISERSHAFPDSYKNQIIFIIEGLEQALYYFELE